MRRGSAILLLAGLLLLAGAGWAAGDGPYELSWYTVAGGAGTLSGGGYTLGGTAGQAAAGVMAGGGYTLGGGFSPGGVVTGPWLPIYLPLVTRGSP